MYWIFVFASLVLVQCRLPNSPYPIGVQPTLLWVVDDSQLTPSEMVVIESLQGLLPKTDEEQVFRINKANPTGATEFLADLTNTHGIPSTEVAFEVVIQHFAENYKGYILFDNSSVNVALSLVSQMSALVASVAEVPIMQQNGLKMLLDARSWTESGLFGMWQQGQYNFSKTILTHQALTSDIALHDYSVFTDAFIFSADMTDPLFMKVLGIFAPMSLVFGWASSELSFVALVSEQGMYVHASDWAKNLATLTNFEIDSFEQIGAAPGILPSQPNTHTVTFVMTDGDNVQWLLNDFTTNTDWWASTDRGTIPLGWTMSPALSELAPTVLQLLYSQASTSIDLSGGDYFIAAPSGVGYSYPDVYLDSATQAYTERTEQYMKKANLSIANVIVANENITGANYLLDSDQIDAIFMYPFSDYSLMNGSVAWYNNKPVICGRYNLWDGFNTPQQLAQKLNSLSKDITSTDSYSVIPVHVWSMSVTSVVQTIQLLDANVRVVTPDDLVRLMVENVQH